MTRKGFILDEPWVEDAWDQPAPQEIEVEAERVRTRRRLLKWIVFAVTIGLIAVVLTAGGIGMWVVKRINPPGQPGTPITFTVNDGDTLQTLSARLHEQGIITHAGVFEWYVKRNTDGPLEFVPGYYTLRPRDTMGNVLRVLRTPPAQTYTKVTFPEGFTVTQMATRLSERVTHLNAADFVAAATDGSITSPYAPPGTTNLEGLLFPDTYQVAASESVEDVIKRMVDLMALVGSQEGVDEAGRLLRSPYEVLIIASMIEREAKTDADRPKIARVIYNRLALGMPLQIDATLFYHQDASLGFDRLVQIDTPYNTYLYSGLPPTPIANPGRASIRAAMNPATDPDPNDALCRGVAARDCHLLYYVLADAKGNHAFAVTLAQHEANVAAARAAGLLG